MPFIHDLCLHVRKNYYVLVKDNSSGSLLDVICFMQKASSYFHETKVRTFYRRQATYTIAVIIAPQEMIKKKKNYFSVGLDLI